MALRAWRGTASRSMVWGHWPSQSAMGCSIYMHSVHKMHRLLLQHRSHKMHSHTLVLSQSVLVHTIHHDVHTIHWMIDDLYIFRIIVGAVVVEQWETLVSLSDDTA